MDHCSNTQGNRICLMLRTPLYSRFSTLGSTTFPFGSTTTYRKWHQPDAPGFIDGVLHAEFIDGLLAVAVPDEGDD